MTSLILAVLLSQAGVVQVQNNGGATQLAHRINFSTGATCSMTSGQTWSCSFAGGGGGSGLPADPAACAAGQYVRDQDINGVLACAQVQWSQLGGVPSTFPATVPVSTATALAANPTDCAANQYATTIDAQGNLTCAQVAYSQVTGTPTIPTDVSGKKYLIQTADAALPNAQAMGALATGIVKNTTTTGVQSIAVAGTDYVAATTGSAVQKANGAGGLTAATSGTDYSAGTSGLATGILKSTTGTGALSIAVAGTDYLADGFQFLGSTTMGANAATSATITFTATTYVRFVVWVAGYSGSDIVSLRFGTGAGVDTGQNYSDRNTHTATGGATFTWTECSATANTANCGTATNRVRYRLGSNAITTARLVIVDCVNISTVAKHCHHVQSQSNASAATPDVFGEGTGTWVNTSAQMTQVQMHANAGANLLAGSFIQVFGHN